MASTPRAFSCALAIYGKQVTRAERRASRPARAGKQTHKSRRTKDIRQAQCYTRKCRNILTLCTPTLSAYSPGKVFARCHHIDYTRQPGVIKLTTVRTEEAPGRPPARGGDGGKFPSRIFPSSRLLWTQVSASALLPACCATVLCEPICAHCADLRCSLPYSADCECA